MTDPNQPPPPEPGRSPFGPPEAVPGPEGYGAPPPGWGTPPGGPPPPGWGAQPGGQFAQPAAQPFTGGHYGPDWIPEIGRQLGSAGARIGAKAIDIVLVFIVTIVLSFAGAAALLASSDTWASNSFGGGSGRDLAVNFGISLVILGFDFVYNVVLVARAGGQPGKLICGLRVVRSDGAPADLRTAFLRWSPMLAIGVLSLVPIVSLFALLARFVLLVVNLVLVLSDGRRQSVFDKVAGTYVVTAR